MPCPPEDVEPVLDCSTNTARVTWQASRGADLYIVQAFGVEEHESACETDSQSCILAELLCGFTYNISVIAANSVCNISQSGITQMKAGKDSQRHLTCRSLVHIVSAIKLILLIVINDGSPMVYMIMNQYL